RQLLEMLSEWRAELLRTAFSMMMHSRPILIDPPSAITCAPNMTRQSGPIVTLPQITAFGAIQAAGAIRGVAASWLMIIWDLCDLYISHSAAHNRSAAFSASSRLFDLNGKAKTLRIKHSSAIIVRRR